MTAYGNDLFESQYLCSMWMIMYNTFLIVFPYYLMVMGVTSAV